MNGKFAQSNVVRNNVQTEIQEFVRELDAETQSLGMLCDNYLCFSFFSMVQGCFVVMRAAELARVILQFPALRVGCSWGNQAFGARVFSVFQTKFRHIVLVVGSIFISFRTFSAFQCAFHFCCI